MMRHMRPRLEIPICMRTWPLLYHCANFAASNEPHKMFYHFYQVQNVAAKLFAHVLVVGISVIIAVVVGELGALYFVDFSEFSLAFWEFILSPFADK